jgi:hypothetical protein
MGTKLSNVPTGFFVGAGIEIALLLSVPPLVTAYGLLKGKKWSIYLTYLTLGLSIFTTTILGIIFLIITLVVLSIYFRKPHVKEYFGMQYFSQPITKRKRIIQGIIGISLILILVISCFWIYIEQQTKKPSLPPDVVSAIYSIKSSLEFSLNNWYESGDKCFASKSAIENAKSNLTILRDYSEKINITPENEKIVLGLRSYIGVQGDVINFIACFPESRGVNCEYSMGAICLEGMKCLVERGKHLKTSWNNFQQSYPEITNALNLQPPDVDGVIKKINETICVPLFQEIFS